MYDLSSLTSLPFVVSLLLPLLLIPLLIAPLYPCLGCHGRCFHHGVRRQSSFVLSSTGLVFIVGLFLGLGSVWFVSFPLASSSFVAACKASSTSFASMVSLVHRSPFSCIFFNLDTFRNCYGGHSAYGHTGEPVPTTVNERTSPTTQGPRDKRVLKERHSRDMRPG